MGMIADQVQLLHFASKGKSISGDESIFCLK